MSIITRAIDQFTARLAAALAAPPAMEWSPAADLEAELYPATEPPSQFALLSNTSGLRCLVCKKARAIFQCRLCDTMVCVDCDCCPNRLEVQP